MKRERAGWSFPIARAAERWNVEASITTKELTTMIEALHEVNVADGDPVAAEGIPLALTAGNLVYDDGATQR
jgi:hypothetical protein